MTFGWQGFQIDHPDDWAPASLTGNRDAGYARVASAHRLALQIRWQRGKPTDDLGARLKIYLDRLEADSKKARQPFSFDTSTLGEELVYRWRGIGRGAGAVIHKPECGRTFLIELVGGKKDSLRSDFQKYVSSFQSGTPLWSVLGISLRLEAELQKHEFKAGKTVLQFTRQGAAIDVSRWGFAQQLVAKHSLSEWSKAATGMAKAEVCEEAAGLRLRSRSFLSKSEALIRLDCEHNQIITVKSTFRRDEDAPEWAWLV